MTAVAGIDVSPDHYIGGERVASAARFEDRSPIDWSPARRGRARRRRPRSTWRCAPRTTRSRRGPRSARPAARRTCTGSPT